MITAERLLRFTVHEANLIRRLASSTGRVDHDRLESLLLLLPVLEKAVELQPMEDAEADAVRFQIKQELIGKSAYQHAA